VGERKAVRKYPDIPKALTDSIPATVVYPYEDMWEMCWTSVLLPKPEEGELRGQRLGVGESGEDLRRKRDHAAE
jgi:hypothetical protein